MARFRLRRGYPLELFPQACQRGPQVFVIKEDGTAESRAVKVARTVGQESLISEGISAGEKVVTNGQSRLMPGSKVIPVPETGVKKGDQT